MKLVATGKKRREPEKIIEEPPLPAPTKTEAKEKPAKASKASKASPTALDEGEMVMQFNEGSRGIIEELSLVRTARGLAKVDSFGRISK